MTTMTMKAKRGDASDGGTPLGGRLSRIDGQGDSAEASLQVVLQTESYDALFRAAIDGAGIAVLPRYPATDYFESGALVNVLPDWIFGRYAVYAALPTRKLIPARTKAFLDFATTMALRSRGPGMH